MSDLHELKKTIFADGQIDEKDIIRLREAIFDEVGMTKEKADFLFELKDSISRKRIIRELETLFVEAVTTFLLKDEESPGEIDESEAKWLRVKIQYKGHAAIIDIDGLVVPGKYPPDVLGTPDFIAPEVIATKHLKMGDAARQLPKITTDRHALAVLIYMYLLYRHPLRGGKVWDTDPAKDEDLSMGEKALFVEHPTDKTNRVKANDLQASQLPQGDPTKIPYTVCGPYLKELFDRAFIDGLHNPAARPTADEWLQALLKTVDLMQPCQNANCWYKWFVFDNSTKPKCPFCETEYHGQLPVLNLYSSRRAGSFTPDNYRLMVYNNQYLYQWHVNRNVSPNEKLTAEQKKPIGYFVFHNNKWLLVNQRLNDLEDKTEGKKIPITQAVELTDGKQILLSKEDGGRLIIVQLVKN
jgi:serine/threonine protein kinase